MSETLQAQWPSLLGFIADEGRYVVQIFLVIGGYLASRSLFSMLDKQRDVQVWSLVQSRFLRLAKPFWVAIAMAVFLSWLAGKIAMHAAVPDMPTFLQLVAHVFFLHDIVGVEALSAGIWYVAIDLQLFAVLVFLSWASQKFGSKKPILAVRVLLLLACSLALGSLWWWNRNADHDEWALYFFGSYGLGVFAYWMQRTARAGTGSMVIAAVLGLALWIEWRERLLLTGITALLLIHSARIEQAADTLTRGPVRWLGDISYSVFLIHYGVAVFASSVMIALGVQGLMPMLLAFVLTWAVCVAAGWVLSRTVD